jgi:hypothetical protein
LEEGREVINTRTETRTVECGRSYKPIMETRERRRRGWRGLVSIDGSGYETYEVQIGTNTIIHWREEQRVISILRCGIEQFGDWRVTGTGST